LPHPGRAPPQSAANPARTKELYFVSDGAGGLIPSDVAFRAAHDKGDLDFARKYDLPVTRVVADGGGPL